MPAIWLNTMRWGRSLTNAGKILPAIHAPPEQGRVFVKLSSGIEISSQGWLIIGMAMDTASRFPG